MDIKFELFNEKEVKIMNDGKEVGRIFSPAGTMRDVTNAIQICGFKDAYDLWGCGVFFDKNSENNRDIQLYFKEDSHTGSNHEISKFELLSDCGRCFMPKKKCKCYDLKIKTKKDIEKDLKEVMLEKLE